MPLSAVFLAALFSSAKDLVSKKLAFAVSGGLSAFASFAFAIPYYLVALLISYLLGSESFAITGVFLVLVILRSITDTAGEYCKMHALSYGDISLVSPLLALAPVMILLLSPAITGDPLTRTGIISVSLVVAGTLVLVWQPRGAGANIDFRAISYSFGTSIFFALNNCFDRLAVQEASPLISAFAMTLLSCIFLAPLALRKVERREHLVQFSRPFILRGLFETLYMVAKLYAMQTLQAPYVSALLKVSLLFSLIGGKVMFGETDLLRRASASILILAGVCAVILDS